MAYSQSWVNSTPAHPIVVNVTPTAGDVLIAWQVSDVTSAAGAAPTGFEAAAVADLTSTFDNSRLTVWIKKNATGSETTVSMTESSANLLIGGVIAFSGINNTTPQDVAAATFSSSASGTTASASLTPVTNGVDLCAILDADTGGVDSTFTFATSSGTTGAWTVRQDQNSGFYNVGVGSATQTTAGAVTVQGTQSNAGGRLFALLALRPATNPPVITVQPADQTVNAGSTATFTVTATGATSYQWNLNGSPIGGATSSSYTTGTVAFSDQGNSYTVDCTNTDGTTTSTAALLRVAFNLSGTGARRRQTFASTPFASTGPLGAPAGGGPITGSISETLSAADTVTASAVFASAVAETAAAVDTITAAAITAAAVAETGSAADSVSAAVTFNSVVAETLAAVDTPSALLVLIAQVNETLTALDTPTASALFNAAVQETLAAADTVTASAVFNASVSETLSAVDTTDATISGGGGTTYNDSVSETLSAQDTVSASAIYAGAITETLAATDTTDALLAQLGAIVETLAASETVTGLTAATALVSETGAAADTITALLLSTASVQEVLSAVDTITSQGIFTASIVESMNATDSTDATGGSAPTTSGHAYWLLLKRRTRR